VHKFVHHAQIQQLSHCKPHQFLLTTLEYCLILFIDWYRSILFMFLVTDLVCDVGNKLSLLFNLDLEISYLACFSGMNNLYLLFDKMNNPDVPYNKVCSTPSQLQYRNASFSAAVVIGCFTMSRGCNYVHRK